MYELFAALTSMLTLSKNALNSGDVTTLYQLYSAEDPPPVAFLRLPQVKTTIVSNIVLGLPLRVLLLPQSS